MHIMAIFHDFEDIAFCRINKRAHAPVVDDEQFGSRELVQLFLVRAISPADPQFMQEPGKSDIGRAYASPAGGYAKGACKPSLTGPRRAGNDEISMIFNPVIASQIHSFSNKVTMSSPLAIIDLMLL